MEYKLFYEDLEGFVQISNPHFHIGQFSKFLRKCCNLKLHPGVWVCTCYGCKAMTLFDCMSSQHLHESHDIYSVNCVLICFLRNSVELFDRDVRAFGGWTIWWSGFDSRWVGWEFLYSTPLPDWLWVPPNPMSNEYRGFFPWR